MTQAKHLAKVANITEQQAVTMAVLVRSNMRQGMTLDQAVDAYMTSIRALAACSRADQ